MYTITHEGKDYLPGAKGTAHQDVTLCDCGHPAEPSGISTGYARYCKCGILDCAGCATMCYTCAAEVEQAEMQQYGRAALYLDTKARTVSNWTGKLTFRVRQMSTGRHNMAGRRVDVWFRDSNGALWHGVQYGEWTQIVHCKRLKAQ